MAGSRVSLGICNSEVHAITRLVRAVTFKEGNISR